MKLFSPPPRSGDGRQAPPPKSRSNRLAKQGLDEVSAAFAADVDYTGDRPINSIRPDPVSPVGDPHMTDGLHATTRGRPNRAADGFEFLDHPGDVKLRTWGIDLERFFANAVEGMMTFLFGNGIANLQLSSATVLPTCSRIGRRRSRSRSRRETARPFSSIGYRSSCIAQRPGTTPTLDLVYTS
jgi:Archease protein family (MTH1598/TM1083)